MTVTVHVVRPFMMTYDDGRQEKFPVGEYDLPENLASHWFVQGNLSTAKPPKPTDPFEPIFAKAARESAMQRRMAEQREAERLTAEAAANTQASEPTDFLPGGREVAEHVQVADEAAPNSDERLVDEEGATPDNPNASLVRRYTFPMRNDPDAGPTIKQPTPRVRGKSAG